MILVEKLYEQFESWMPSVIYATHDREVIAGVIKEFDHLFGDEFWEYNFTVLCFLLLEAGEVIYEDPQDS